MRTLPKIDRRAWLAWWAQQRRRARHTGPAEPVGPLLINLYFNEQDTRTGAAAVGQAGDYWNRLADASYGVALADRTRRATPARITISGYPGKWNTGLADPMMDNWIYNWDFYEPGITLTGLPAGYWDLYCYTPLSQRYFVAVTGQAQIGPLTIPVGEWPLELPFTEGVNYVRFRAVFVAPGDDVVIYKYGVVTPDPPSLFGFQLLESVTA